IDSPAQSIPALIPATVAEWLAAFANAAGTCAPARIAASRIPPCQNCFAFALANMFDLRCLDSPFIYMSVERIRNRQRPLRKIEADPGREVKNCRPRPLERANP